MALRRSNEECSTFVEHPWRKGFCVKCSKMHTLDATSAYLLLDQNQKTQTQRPTLAEIKNSKMSNSSGEIDLSSSPNSDKHRISKLERENNEMRTLLKDVQTKSIELQEQLSQQTRYLHLFHFFEF